MSIFFSFLFFLFWPGIFAAGERGESEFVSAGRGRLGVGRPVIHQPEEYGEGRRIGVLPGKGRNSTKIKIFVLSLFSPSFQKLV